MVTENTVPLTGPNLYDRLRQFALDQHLAETQDWGRNGVIANAVLSDCFPDLDEMLTRMSGGAAMLGADSNMVIGIHVRVAFMLGCVQGARLTSTLLPVLGLTMDQVDADARKYMEDNDDHE